MARTTEHPGRRGLSRWPRMLFAGTAAILAPILAIPLLFNSATTELWWLLLPLYFLVVIAPGAVMALLASPGETNPWRTTGIRISLVAYMGVAFGAVLSSTSPGAWLYSISLRACVLAGLYTLPAYLVTRRRKGADEQPDSHEQRDAWRPS
jgi:hypothetical protein